MSVISYHRTKEKINVLIATPQSYPFVGAGGLAPFIREFVEAMRIVPLNLPKLDVRVIIPYYDGVGKYTGFDAAGTGIEDFKEAQPPLIINTDVQDENGEPYEVTVEQASVLTRGGPILYYALRNNQGLFSEPIFSRIPESAGASPGEIDKANKSAIKFAVFSNAVVKFLQDSGGRQLLGNWFPHVIHCHDWPTGLIPAYLASLYNDPKYWQPRKPETLFTFHLCPPGDGAQGVFTQENSNWGADNLLKGAGWGQGDIHTVYTGTPNLQHECDAILWQNYDPNWSNLNCGVSFLKAGLDFSDKANTVSPGYALEMQDPPHSFGNEVVISKKQSESKWQGIRNGISYEDYDAQRDEYIIAPYTQDNWEIVKERNKVELLTHPHRGLDSRLQKLAIRLAEEGRSEAYPRSIAADELNQPDFDWKRNFILNFRSFHLDEDSFLAVFSARLAWQKGVDIALDGMRQLFEKFDKLHLIIMGNGPEAQRLASIIEELAKDFPDRFMFINWYDRTESHIWERLLISAADLFLMPSRTEPCGIVQQRAIHYGVPVLGSEVGGLRNVPENTVIKLEGIRFGNLLPENANAILFPLQYPANPDTPEFSNALKAFKEAMEWAYDIWQNEPESWKKLVKNAMEYPNSWDFPVGKYREKYIRLAR